MAKRTKVRLQKLEMAILTKKSAHLFDLDMQDFLGQFKLPTTKYNQYDILEIWNDIRVSIGHADHEGRGANLKLFEWEDPKAWAGTKVLLKKMKGASEVYPIEITSRLLKWYSIFRPAYLDLPSYEPLKRDYRYFFTLRGNGKVEKLEEMAGGTFLFYHFIHRLFSYQAQNKRTIILRHLLSDQTIISQLEANYYVVPANLQFILSTPQVYHAYANAIMEGKTLPLPPPHAAAERNMHGFGDKKRQDLEKLFRQVQNLKEQGTEVTFLN